MSSISGASKHSTPVIPAPPAPRPVPHNPQIGPAKHTVGGRVFPAPPVPHLLQQIELLMGAWRHPPVPPLQDTALAAIDRDQTNFEIVRSVLSLYVSAAGSYEPVLSRCFDFLFNIVNRIFDDATTPTPSVTGQLSPGLSESDGGVKRIKDKSEGSLVPAKEYMDPVKKCEYAFSRVENAERRMANLKSEAEDREFKLREEILQLENEVNEYRHRIEHYVLKAKGEHAHNARLTDPELQAELEKVDGERKEAMLRKAVIQRDERIRDLLDDVDALKKLNGKYAVQAIELAARVRVFNEHNDKFATLLSLQHDEKLHTDKENELLKAELMDLNKHHILRDNLEGESGTVNQTFELRGVRYGVGNNPFVPAHLRYARLVNRVTMPKEACLTIVSDIVVQRNAGNQQRKDFCSFISDYLLRKQHMKEESIAQCYALDEACRVFDADVNLNCFGLVSRRQLSELIYHEWNTDIQIFLEGCEAIDMIQHQSDTGKVPINHVVGLLVEMFPSYKEAALHRLIDSFQASLTSEQHAYYRGLFPNLERNEVTMEDPLGGGLHDTAFSQVELRGENIFSLAFKELILDDAVLTLQEFEDQILKTSTDKVSINELMQICTQMFTAEAVQKEHQAQIRKAILDSMGTQFEVQVNRHVARDIIRTKCILRRAIWREHNFALTQRIETLVAKVYTNDAIAAAAKECSKKIDYRAILQSTNARRKAYYTEEDEKLEQKLALAEELGEASQSATS